MRMVIGVVLLISAGCSSIIAAKKEHPQKQEAYGAQIGIVNHTDKYIYTTSVGDGGGGHAHPYSAGVANICCVTMPDKWYPGLKFLVGWDMPVGSKHVYKEKMVEVEKYEEPGSVYLHFFADDQVRIVVSTWVGGAGKHPIPGPVKPADYREPRTYNDD
jgi:hypothetical protein